jgi:prolyl oligopeptidase
MFLTRPHCASGKLYRRWLIAAAVLTLLPGVCGAQISRLPSPPPTPRRAVADVYHGVKVSDDYRWLEDGKDPLVQQWSDAQNQRTQAYLDSLPSRLAIRAALENLMKSTTGRYYDARYQAGVLFARKVQPPLPQPVLVALPSTDDPSAEKIVVDPNALGDKASIAIDTYAVSLDGKFVAVSLSANGTEDGTARVFEVATGKELGDRVPRVNGPTAGGSLAWKADASGFYYTRYPRGDERPKADLNFFQQVYFHKLGTESSQDTYVIGKEFPRIAEIMLSTSPDGGYLLASVANGDGGQYEHFLMDPGGRWTQITHLEDGIVQAKFGPDDSLYVLSRKKAPRGKILRMPFSTPRLANAKVVVKQSRGGNPTSDERARASIEDFTVTANRLYVEDIIGGPARVRIFDHHGKKEGELPLPPISSVAQIVPVSEDDILVLAATWIDPPAWYRFNASARKLEPTALAVTSPAKFPDAEVVREFATSRDGTRVPLNIIRKKSTPLDGSNPVILEGYGGYNISLVPMFIGPTGRFWLDQGGVFVIANLRGGGEYGEEWHQAGKLARKQNVYDDFIACAQHLIERKYTSPSRLAILGGSNGGLLMGAVLTQRPELFRAVVSFVGIYDSLRAELDPNGEFNIPEYGSVKDPEQFKALYAYSPYHHVKDGTAYPAVLFFTGANDGRVNPYHSRKMTARLQAATTSDHPILLRTNPNTGHATGGLNQALEQNTDLFSFLLDQLGIKAKTEVATPANMLMIVCGRQESKTVD